MRLAALLNLQFLSFLETEHKKAGEAGFRHAKRASQKAGEAFLLTAQWGIAEKHFKSLHNGTYEYTIEILLS